MIDRPHRRLRLEHRRSTSGWIAQAAPPPPIAAGGLMFTLRPRCRTIRALSCSDPIHIVHDGGQDHGRATPKGRFVAGQRPTPAGKTGNGPDEQSEMRYPTRASELDHRRLPFCLPPCTITLLSHPYRKVGEGLRMRKTIDNGHQSILPTRNPKMW